MNKKRNSPMTDEKDSRKSLMKFIEFIASAVFGAILGVLFERLSTILLTALAISVLIFIIIIFFFPNLRKSLIFILLGLFIGVLVSITVFDTDWPPKILPANMLLNEQYDIPTYDGTLNENLWWIRSTDTPSDVSHTQDNGLLTSIMQPLEGDDSEIYSLQQWSINEIDYLEARARFDKLVYGDWASLAIGITTDSGDRFNCDLIFDVGNNGFRCNLWNLYNNKFLQIPAGPPFLKPNTWHIVRIEIIRNPLEFKVYLDGQLNISHIVENASVWQDKNVNVYISLAGDNIQSAIITKIDYIILVGQ